MENKLKDSQDLKNTKQTIVEKTSKQQAQEILTVVTAKLNNKELILNDNDVLKIFLPEDKIICIFNTQNSVQMLGFTNENHFNEFAEKNFTDKKIIDYK